MKRIFCGLLLVVVLSSFIMAGSEISTNFVVGGAGVKVSNYVPAENFWSGYGSYMIGVLATFVVGYFISRIKGKTTIKRKKRKKVSKKKTKKKI